jgi:hypothetical protein
MAVEDVFAEILTEEATRRISFNLDGLSVNGTGFGRIASFILNEQIRVRRHRDLPVGVAASYKYRQNLMLVRSYSQEEFQSISNRAMVVHEAVHAIIDYEGLVGLSLWTGEVGAYLAQVLYRINRRDRIRAWAEAHQTEAIGRIFHEAIQLIDRHGLTIRHAHMDFIQYDALRQAVGSHPTYENRSEEFHGADGI